MSFRYPLHAVVLGLAAASVTVACSPALNWREVPLEGLIALLPCKPDHAQRRVRLGVPNSVRSNLVLQVSGCEAAGALYAISHIHAQTAGQVEPTRAAWRQATLTTLQATAVAVQPLRLAKPVAGRTGDMAAVTPFMLETLAGKRPDGTAVQAQLAWLVKGPDIYQVAVYGAKLDKAMTELLFSELRLL